MKKILKWFIVSLLTGEAKLVIKKYKPRVVAVTGSVGKTSTKDALGALLAGFFSARKSEKSFNSELGVPLTILGLGNAWSNPMGWLRNILGGLGLIIFKLPYPTWIVLEVGADRPGDIRKISSWLKPDSAVFTRFAKTPVHIEFFTNAESVIEEKGALARAVKSGGILILNADDSQVLALKDSRVGITIKTYGMAPGADVVASEYRILYNNKNGRETPEGISFSVTTRRGSISVRVMDSLGHQHVYPILAAIALGEALNLPLAAMGEKLSAHIPQPGRMKIIEGIKNTIIIDDTYNSSPVAVEEALATLEELKVAGRKFAVLGDMLELGKHTVAEHRAAGKLAAKNAATLVTVGVRARQIAEGALDERMDEKNILQFDGSEEAGKYLQDIIAPGDVILIKGSQGVRMEKIVEEIMAEPERAGELLVRQDKEWRSR